MEWDEQLNKGQGWEKVKALLSPEAKKALSSLSEEEQRQLFLSLKQDVEDSRVKDETKEQAKQEELKKFDLLIEEGQKYIDKDKWQEWTDYESSFKGWMFGLDVIERVVEVMKMLDDWVSPEEIKNKMLNDWHLDWYFSIRSTVIRFSKKGKEFEKMSSKWYVRKVSFWDKVAARIEKLYEGLFG